MPPTRPLRVGAVPYLVGRPLIHGLDAEPGIQLSREVPARLVEGLREGSLDVALVSSIELFRRPGYRYLEGSAILGRGFVASVQVFLAKPLDDVQSLALDPASRTAQALAQIMIHRRARLMGRPPPRSFEPASGSARDAGADAWLSIGDAALATTLSPGAPPSFNPSQAWASAFQLPFVFAAWIVRPGVELTDGEIAAFAAARAAGSRPACIEALAAEAARQFGLAREDCLRYLAEECGFEAGTDLPMSLRRLRDEAAALGLADASLEPRAIAAPTASTAKGSAACRD